MSAVVTIIGLASVSMFFLKISDIKIENGRLKIIRTNQVELSPAASVLTQSTEGVYIVNEPTPEELESALPVSPQRVLPGGLKAIGILNIVFGGLGTVWNLGRMLLAFLVYFNYIPTAENIEMQIDLAWSVTASGLMALAAFLFVISGIGILALRNWARILAIIAACLKLILGTIEVISVALTPIETAADEQRFITGIVKGFYIFCVLLTIVYPVIVLILLPRRTTRELFKRDAD
jgi:hypothetical protein